MGLTSTAIVPKNFVTVTALSASMVKKPLWSRAVSLGQLKYAAFSFMPAFLMFWSENSCLREAFPSVVFNGHMVAGWVWVASNNKSFHLLVFRIRLLLVAIGFKAM
jgi:hypothetical protein